MENHLQLIFGGEDYVLQFWPCGIFERTLHDLSFKAKMKFLGPSVKEIWLEYRNPVKVSEYRYCGDTSILWLNLLFFLVEIFLCEFDYNFLR